MPFGLVAAARRRKCEIVRAMLAALLPTKVYTALIAKLRIRAAPRVIAEGQQGQYAPLHAEPQELVCTLLVEAPPAYLR